jgi:hypothetical protein
MLKLKLKWKLELKPQSSRFDRRLRVFVINKLLVRHRRAPGNCGGGLDEMIG